MTMLVVVPISNRRFRGPVARSIADAARVEADGPATVEPTPTILPVDDGWVATLEVTGLPAQVGPCWLEPLLSWPGLRDVAVHIEPVPEAAHPADRVAPRSAVFRVGLYIKVHAPTYAQLTESVAQLCAGAGGPFQYRYASWPRTTPGSPVTAAPLFEDTP